MWKSFLYSGEFSPDCVCSFMPLDLDFFNMTGGQETQETAILVGLRKAMMSADAMRGLLLHWQHWELDIYTINQKLNQSFFLASVSVLALVDIIGINQRYLDHSDYVKSKTKESTHTPRPVDQQILQDKTAGYRVMDLTMDPYSNAMPSYFHHMVGGYHPAKLRRYQDLIDRCLEPERGMLQSILQTFTGDPNDSNFVSSMNQLKVYNMLNTKYFILGERGKEMPLINNAANGSAWIVSNIHWVNSGTKKLPH
ncbi:MAG: hypothetical protein IPH93_14055 [Saprospiraceae bacterium]|nr:hypothetical protein [Saprospiraceae bacterium]